MSAVKAPKAVKPVTEYEDPLAIDPAKPDHKAKLDPKKIILSPDAQARDDTDKTKLVDTHRAEDFAEKMKAGEKFPPVKVMLVEDHPDHKGKPVYVAFDGFHTVAGAEIAKLKELDALVWKGSVMQAVAAAATVANREHENNGKPLSYDDKIRSLMLYAKALKKGGVEPKLWPSNRQAAVMFGVSHTAVGDEDPFGRRREGTKDKETKLAEKKVKRVAGKGTVEAGREHLEGKGGKVFEVVQKTTGQVAATYDADTPAKALEQFKAEKPEANLVEYVAREGKPKGGTPTKFGFDWSSVTAALGQLARGLDAAGDLHDLKRKPEYKLAVQQVSSISGIVEGWRKETAKAKAGENGKPKEEAAKK
jgi:uncharacterized ParB-like nuclease family protein